MATKTLNVKGMHCKSCEMLITDALTDMGATKVKANHKKWIVQYEGDVSDEKVKATIRKEGYEV